MPNIQQEDLGNQAAKLTITIMREDYEPEFQAELKKRQKSANIRGFRPGKAPMNYLKKVMGPSILSNMVFEKLQKELFAYYQEHQNKLHDLPGISAESPAYDFEQVEMQDYVFHMDAYFVEDMELFGLRASDEYEKLVCEVTDEMVQESFDKFMESQSTPVEVDGAVQEGDILYLDLSEMKDGSVLEDGIERNNLMLQFNDLSESAKKELLGKEVEHTFQVNIFDLEENRGRHFVLKYLLDLEQEDIDELDEDWEGLFEATLNTVERNKKPELDEDFFARLFPNGEASDEQSLREHIRQVIGEQINREMSRSLLSDAIISRFMEENLERVALPESFLNESVEHELSEQENLPEGERKSEEEIRKNLEKGLKQSALIKMASNKFNIAISQEEIRQGMFWQIMEMYQLSPEILQSNPQFVELISKMADDRMKDEQALGQARISIFFDRLVNAALDTVKLNEKSISMEALQNAYKERFAREEDIEEEEA
jgi:trigger factor